MRYIFVKKFLLIVLLWLHALCMMSQQEASFAHYWAMEPSFNPGAVGKESKINVTGAYNMSFAGYEHNPKTMYIAADMPLQFLGARHGVGVQLLNDEIGLFTHKRILVQYALKQRLLGGTLSIGVQGGMLSEGFKGSEVDFPDEESDPAFVTTDATGTGLDLSAGLYYQHKNWYVGVSALHVTAPVIDIGDRSVFEMSRMFYLTGGYNIHLRNPFITIHPTVLGRTDGSAYRADMTVRVKYTHDRKMLYAGVGYSPSNSVTAMVGGNFHGICLGYSYEMFTSGAGPGNGCHELFVGYQVDLKMFKKGRNRHQSVRIL
ncbi:MAG: type IX secretion system membrane protein PorP/SprF [Prevotella sp.]|nr:type IX secretion system membrane protein PorP/SprF [Prevotella sp.]